MIEVQVTRERAGLRLDRFLALELTDFSRSRLQTLIESGFVRLNKQQQTRSRELVRNGDIVAGRSSRAGENRSEGGSDRVSDFA